MRNLLSLLLVPFFVLGSAVPHSHAGIGVGEPDDHAARPHVHLSVGHSHDHGHHDGSDHQHGVDVSQADHVAAAAVFILSIPADHDSDAVYLAQSTSSISRISADLPTDVYGVPAFIDCWVSRSNASPTQSFDHVHHRCGAVPIYLLVASLRL